MSFFKTLLGFLAATLLIISCKKELSNEEGNLNTEVESKWEFKEGGQQFDGTTDTAFIQNIGSIQTLTITGVQAEGLTGEMMIQIAGEEINTGVYGTQFVLFQFLQNGSLTYTSSPVEGSDFIVSITAIDSSSVTGEFSGTVEDALGNNYTITDGKFKAALGTGQVQNPPIENGQLTVWSKQICSDASAIEVTVLDQTGQITDAFTVQPDCGAPGTATFTLPAGIYSVSATCSGTTVTYEVTIDRECVFLEVVLENPQLSGDYLPLTLGASWSYNDVAGSASEQTIIAEEEGVNIEDQIYTRLVSDNGSEYLYRKNGHAYFQYLTMDFQGTVQGADPLAIKILQDDLAEGQSWESPVITGTMANVPMKAKLVSTIVRRDFTTTINGIDYADCIEVSTELYVASVASDNFTATGSVLKRTFAKGIGIVQYDDLSQAITWGITNVVLNP